MAPLVRAKKGCFVTTATKSDHTVPLLGGRNHFLLRRLHSLTGIVFGGYLVVHLIVNATIAQVGESYQIQVRKIHELPLVWAIEWLFIFLPIIYHTIYGIWITVTGQPNNDRYGYVRNWSYLLQRISAVIIVLFMLFHVLSLKYGVFGATLSFDPHQAKETVYRHMNASWLIAWVIYPIGILASTFHMANGFWAAAITWGLTISASAQKRWGMACIGLFLLMTFLGMTALVYGTLVNPAGPEAPTRQIQEPVGG
jgi:succinate dehydrogenase / fumarate reductase cytochrome b subunit